MKFVLNAHARIREKGRSVSRHEIAYALNNYQLSVTASPTSTRLECRFPDGSVLKVWVEGKIPLGEPVLVLSVAWKGSEYVSDN